MPGVPWPLVKKYNNTHIEMKKTIKTTYAPPASEVLELKTQGIICQSINGTTTATMSGPFEEIII